MRIGRHTLPGQHSDGDAGVTELDEWAALTVNALTSQEEVFRAHVSVDQVFILLQSGKSELSEAARKAACLRSCPHTVFNPSPQINLSTFPGCSQTQVVQLSHHDLGTLYVPYQ